MTSTRGTLRVYLGAAPGVGKTYAMLNEGRRRIRRGTDLVVGYVECHDRARTVEQLDGLEIVPRKTRYYRGSTFTEMDVDAVLARAPEVALVDELAHTNVPGSRNEKRWQDVEELLEAGIHVITTVNVQHLESLNDVVEHITGIKQQETVPDAVVRAADQIELVDSTPEALRRRMAHGNIYAPDKVDAALANYFRIGNLAALRELALLWLADRVDEGLQRYRQQHEITGTWEARERVVVSITGGPESRTLIRRAARIAARSTGGDLLAVHVSRSDGLAGTSPAALSQHRRLVESLGGTFHQIVGDNVPRALLEFARAENATQLVVGTSRRGRWAHFLTGPGIGATVIRHSGDIDVHIVTHEQAGHGRRLPAMTGGLSLKRRITAAAVGALGLPALTVILVETRADLTFASQILLYLILVIAVTLIGGIFPAVAAAAAASLVLNFYFAAPLHTFTINDLNNIIALLVFLFVAVAVSSVVDLAARRNRQAARATGEAETLSMLAGTVLSGKDALQALVDRLRETFAMEAVSLLRRDSSEHWELVACSGPSPCLRPDDAQSVVPVDDGYQLAMRGPRLPAADQRILVAFAAQAAAVLQQRRLSAAVAAAKPLEELDRTRTALLAAVSHDLRTPLASVKAAVDSLRDEEVHWSPVDQQELLATAAESIDRLSALVENLLDMSRLQAGALPVFARRVAIDEIVPHVLDGLGAESHAVTVKVPVELPEVIADPALLERILANIIGNALQHGAATEPPKITASALGERVEIRVLDRGRGIAEGMRERVFTPFQREGDRDNTTGVGLGLALSRGLAESMGGSLMVEDTPGGGVTMVLSLRAAEPAASAIPPPAQSQLS